ncbi:hypothetical protein [Sphingomonas sp.]|uniref:hypothetical protein n=1 Tax=Sphingomonas sp. TaxID=28214 RepID=UPI003D6CAC4C
MLAFSNAVVLRRGATLMLVLLLASLALGSLLPIYTDEVGWRFQLSRYLQDGGVDRFLAETCGANTNATPAFFMMPVRWFSSLLTRFLSDPALIRLSGVGCAVLGVFGIRTLIRRTTDDVRRRATIDLLCFALLGIGVLPLLLVWSRPEQPLWLAVLAATLIALRRPRNPDALPIGPVAAILFLALLAISYHLKALFYLPLFVLAIILCRQGDRRFLVRGAALTLLFALAWLGYRYWSQRFACPDDPVLAAKLAEENASILLLGGGWRSMVSMAPDLIGNMVPGGYIELSLPKRLYMSDWLPSDLISPDAQRIWKRIGHSVWNVALATGLVALVLTMIRPDRRWKPLLIALALIVCATAWAALQLNKGVYEAALYMPVIVAALALILAVMPGEGRWLAPVAWVIAAVSLISQVALIGIYGPRLWSVSGHGGYVAQQPYSLGAYGYAALRRQIVSAGAKCGITPESPRVLIDDLTYFAYSEGYRPVHRLGLLSVWNGSAGDPMTWMRAHGSSGAVIGCHYLPPAMRARAIATGPFCCVKPN